MTGLLLGLQGGLAKAQTPRQPPSPDEWALGFSSYEMRPQHGVRQIMNGGALEYRHPSSGPWSGEVVLSTQTATEAIGVNMRQFSLTAGPRYSWVWNPRWQGYAHVLAGWQHLKASNSFDSDQKGTLALAPGLGVDYAIHRRVSVRIQEDLAITRYAGLTQRSPSFTLAVVLRK